LDGRKENWDGGSLTILQIYRKTLGEEKWGLSGSILSLHLGPVFFKY